MAIKICAAEHCEETFEAKAARKFCDLHAGVKKPKSPKKPKTTTCEAADEGNGFIVPLYVTEPQLDDFWTKLPIEEKALAIQLYWDNIQD